MDRDFDGFDVRFDARFDVSDEAFPPATKRRNPGSVAEMLAILADRMSLERPLSDAELAAKHPEGDLDDDAEWDDREDPNYFAWLED